MAGLQDSKAKANGPEIVRLRRAKGWTQKGLSEIAEVDCKTLRIAEGSGEVRVNILGAIAEKLEVKPWEIMQDVAAPRGNPELAHRDDTMWGAHDEAESKVQRPSSNAPPRPDLVIGRERVLGKLKKRLLPNAKAGAVHALTAVRGWPGVGKTTVVAELAYDREVACIFVDGILWASLGQDPHVFAELVRWARALDATDALTAETAEDVSHILRRELYDRCMLLIVDDVWREEDGFAFRVGGPRCATLFTSRLRSVAVGLISTPEAVITIDVLTEEASLELLRTLAPTVVREYPKDCLKLVHELEGLPLALQVAGRMLNAESTHAWGVAQLLEELRSDESILLDRKTPAPPEGSFAQPRASIAAILRKSTDLLEQPIRERFALLGAFAPRPATFELNALRAVWGTDDVKGTIRTLVDRGLLEAAGDGRYQMHALLASYARTLLSG